MTLAKGISLCMLISLAAAFPLGSQATAQTTSGRSTPVAGTWAAGALFGFSNPTGDDDLDAEPAFDGYVEHFLTDRVSAKGSLMLLEYDGADVAGTNGVDVAAVNGNLQYQWGGDAVRPFVTGGVGVYDYDPDFGGDETEMGLNAGGGANFPMTDRFGIQIEGTFHGTTADDEPDSFFNGRVGARWSW
ncbi:MAG TPA: outer membrane beta-barrel protein [Candidatus Polarisedimenticolia bacterium]|nr:outer membrane beta-barrel protein [Candidatus Polarisedimenticolia bacterium]